MLWSVVQITAARPRTGARQDHRCGLSGWLERNGSVRCRARHDCHDLTHSRGIPAGHHNSLRAEIHSAGETISVSWSAFGNTHRWYRVLSLLAALYRSAANSCNCTVMVRKAIITAAHGV